MDQLWCLVGLFFLAIFIIYCVSFMKNNEESKKSNQDELVNPAEQINKIGIETVEEMERISEKYLDEVSEYIIQEEKQNI